MNTQIINLIEEDIEFDEIEGYNYQHFSKYFLS